MLWAIAQVVTKKMGDQKTRLPRADRLSASQSREENVVLPQGKLALESPVGPIVTVVCSTGAPSLRAFSKATCSRVSCAGAPRSR